MVTPAKTAPLIPPKAPNLPIGPVDYDQRYIDNLLNALRLYFNQIDNMGQGLLTNSAGGAFIKFPYGSFYQNGVTTLSANITNNSTTPILAADTTDFGSSGYILIGSEAIQYTTKTGTQFDGTITRGVLGTTNVAHNVGAYITEVDATGAGSSKAINLDTVVLSNGVTVGVPDSKIYFNYSGVYNIQFSAQLLNFTTSDDNVTVWLKINGNDLPTSASIQQVTPKHGSSPGAVILALNYVISLSSGDYVELYWASDTGNTMLATYPPGTSPTHPASPAMILTVNFISALP